MREDKKNKFISSAVHFIIKRMVSLLKVIDVVERALNALVISTDMFHLRYEPPSPNGGVPFTMRFSAQQRAHAVETQFTSRFASNFSSISAHRRPRN